MRRSAGELARFLQEDPGGADRQIGGALGNAADRSSLPGLAEPMKQMAKAVVARDLPAFQKSADLLATNLAAERRKSEAGIAKGDDARVELDVVRQALLDSLAALGAEGGAKTPARREFFVEGKPAGDNGTAPSAGTGNLAIRSKPDDLQDVYDGAKRAAALLPQMPEVIKAAESAAGEDGVAPAYREYVRRYFTAEAPKR